MGCSPNSETLVGWLILGRFFNMSTPPVALPSEIFAEKFCRHFAVPVERYESEMLRRSLYPHARLARLFAPAHSFAADRGFVSTIGRLTRRRDLAGETVEFHDDPRNRQFWRRHGRLRVSMQRVHRLFNAVWP